MINWSFRYCYGRGAANVAVPAPRRALEMVPRRSSREFAAALAPLSFALLLPLSVLLLAVINWTLASTENISNNISNSRVTVVMERTAVPVAPKPIVQPSAETPAIELATAAVEPEPLPAENALVAAPPTALEAVLAFEIDGIGSAPQIPVLPAASSIPKLVNVEAGKAGTRAADVAPAANASAPIDVANLDRATFELPGLPAVSLAAPAPNPNVEGVPGESASPFAQGLGTPSAPSVAQLPGPVGSRFAGIELESTALGQSSGGAGAGALDGVPLETLAACSSREREDNLKQQLMRSIESGSQCTGLGGTYSFLEAKNLNAFLMRVSRDTQRALGNRCDELMRAQMCVDAR